MRLHPSIIVSVFLMVGSLVLHDLVGSAGGVSVAEAAPPKRGCPSGQTQAPDGRCVPASSVEKTTDECARRGGVRRGDRCIMPCPAGQTQGPDGRCVRS